MLLSMSLFDFVARLLIVVLIGFAIGFERQLTGHNVSFKTTILIAIGSFAFVSVEVMIGSDATRMAANVITGIGFLCSGVIFKNGATVNGLNTSATLWTTSAISVVVGYGYIYEGLIATAILIGLNIIMALGENHVKPLEKFVEIAECYYCIKVVCLKPDVKKVKKLISENMTKKMKIEEISVEMMNTSKCEVHAKITAEGNPTKDLSAICDKIFEKDVIGVTFERCED